VGSLPSSSTVSICRVVLFKGFRLGMLSVFTKGYASHKIPPVFQSYFSLNFPPGRFQTFIYIYSSSVGVFSILLYLEFPCAWFSACHGRYGTATAELFADRAQYCPSFFFPYARMGHHGLIFYAPPAVCPPTVQANDSCRVTQLASWPPFQSLTSLLSLGSCLLDRPSSGFLPFFPLLASLLRDSSLPF